MSTSRPDYFAPAGDFAFYAIIHNEGVGGYTAKKFARGEEPPVVAHPDFNGRKFDSYADAGNCVVRAGSRWTGIDWTTAT